MAITDDDTADLERTLRRDGHDVRVFVSPDDPNEVQIHYQSWGPAGGFYGWLSWFKRLGWLNWLIQRLSGNG